MSSLRMDKCFSDPRLMSGILLTLIIECYQDVLKTNQANLLNVKIQEIGLKENVFWSIEFRIQLENQDNKTIDFTLMLMGPDCLKFNLEWEYKNVHERSYFELLPNTDYLAIKYEVFQIMHNLCRYLFYKLKES